MSVASRLSTLSRCLPRHASLFRCCTCLAYCPGNGGFPFFMCGDMRIAAQWGVNTIAQYLAGILHSHYTRIERGANIVHQMKRQLFDLSLVAADLFWTVGVPPGAHARFGIGLYTGEVLGNANIPGQANHRIDRLV